MAQKAQKFFGAAGRQIAGCLGCDVGGLGLRQLYLAWSSDLICGCFLELTPPVCSLWHQKQKRRVSLSVPSGKHTKNYGKSPYFMGKTTISMGTHFFVFPFPHGSSSIPCQDAEFSGQVGSFVIWPQHILSFWKKRPTAFSGAIADVVGCGESGRNSRLETKYR